MPLCLCNSNMIKHSLLTTLDYLLPLHTHTCTRQTQIHTNITSHRLRTQTLSTTDTQITPWHVFGWLVTGSDRKRIKEREWEEKEKNVANDLTQSYKEQLVRGGNFWTTLILSLSLRGFFAYCLVPKRSISLYKYSWEYTVCVGFKMEENPGINTWSSSVFVTHCTEIIST